MSDADVGTTADSSVVEAVSWRGTKLKDRYQIERELGRGGFGVVYLARDEQLHGRPVVIKVLLEQAPEQAEWFTKKFHQEREALARLDHPGIVGVLDAGETPEGKPFLVMQFVDGITLRVALRQGAMPLGRAASLVKQIGQALSAAHEKGVYHRDLKPENVMLQDLGGGEELVKIIDFGIATVREARAATQAEQTRVAGSGPYMAPEQLLGKPGARSDIYALGVIAYELVTGKRPFHPESLAHMYILAKQGVKTKPRELRPEVPEAAEACILRALAAEEAARYSKARNFGEELARALAVGTLAAPEPVVEKKSRRGMMAGLVAGVLAAGAAAWVGLRPPPGAFHYSIQVQRYRDENPVGQPFVLAGEMLFQAEHRIRVRVTGERAGYLYILNEGPLAAGGAPSYNILFPGAGEAAKLAANQEISIPAAKEHGIEFDQQEGAEKLWLIWAGKEVAEMEAAKRFGEAEHGGAIGDANLVRSIQAFLGKQKAAVVEKQEANQQTVVRGRGEVVARLMRLEHH